jgi:hypothetical protein
MSSNFQTSWNLQCHNWQIVHDVNLPFRNFPGKLTSIFIRALHVSEDISFLYYILTIKIRWILGKKQKTKSLHAIFQFLTVASMKMAVCWDVAPWGLTDTDRRFRGAYLLHNQIPGKKIAHESHLQWVVLNKRGIAELFLRPLTLAVTKTMHISNDPHKKN